MTTSAGDLHIVMLPWSAFGHLIPFYQLSTSLAKKGVHVSYMSTPKNIERLPDIPPHLAPLMQYVTLPFPAVPNSNLPQGAEATVDIEFDQLLNLKLAYDLLREPFKQLVSSQSPDWIISDFAAHWMPDIARECQVQLMYFSIFTATTLSFLGPPEYLTGEGQKRERSTPDTLTTTPHWGRGIFPPWLVYRPHEAVGLHTGAYSQNASGVTDAERMARIIEGCQAVCFRSCREFEGEFLGLYETLVHKPVVPTGLLPRSKVDERENTSGNWSRNFKWLDEQSSRSVIYVGFGSEARLTKDEVYEIAYGLELSQLAFIWVLRRPIWAADDSEALPPGFVSRTTGKGIVCLGWAPQLKILAHPSVGCSLSHCGWSSIIETLQHGHNLIALPFVVDQGMNARILVEKGLGIEVERREDGSYTRDDVADALRRAMLGDEAQRIRVRAGQVAEIFGDQELHENHYIGELVEFLRNGARSQ